MLNPVHGSVNWTILNWKVKIWFIWTEPSRCSCAVNCWWISKPNQNHCEQYTEPNCSITTSVFNHTGYIQECSRNWEQSQRKCYEYLQKNKTRMLLSCHFNLCYVSKVHFIPFIEFGSIIIYIIILLIYLKFLNKIT